MKLCWLVLLLAIAALNKIVLLVRLMRSNLDCDLVAILFGDVEAIKHFEERKLLEHRCAVQTLLCDWVGDERDLSELSHLGQLVQFPQVSDAVIREVENLQSLQFFKPWNALQAVLIQAKELKLHVARKCRNVDRTKSVLARIELSQRHQVSHVLQLLDFVCSRIKNLQFSHLCKLEAVHVLQEVVANV